MVIFFFSGACAPAANANATASRATAPRISGFMDFSSGDFGSSETDAELGGKRGVAAHALGLEGEVGADHVELRADEAAAARDRLVTQVGVLRARAHAHGAQ